MVLTKHKKKTVNQTKGLYGQLAESLSKNSGYIIDSNEAMKIHFVSTLEIIESRAKKLGNLIINGAELVIGAAGIATEMGLLLIMRGLEEASFGFLNFEKQINASLDRISKVADIAFTYDNRLNDKYFGETRNLFEVVDQQAISTVALDETRKKSNSILNSYLFTGKENVNVSFAGYYPETPAHLKKDKNKYTPYSFPDLPTGPINNIARDVSDISSNIKSLNDVNKAIMEINAATYHNNVANQFNGNIEIVAYGVDEEGQKSIGKATEDAIRKVFLNDYQNTQAMGVYA